MPEVRAASNSPFWPFVLVSTSVGQEGIDFHWWCHAILHWNTPAKHGSTALEGASANPRQELYDLAGDLRDE